MPEEEKFFEDYSDVVALVFGLVGLALLIYVLYMGGTKWG